jgi:Ner family transcriptional regulator
MLLMATNHERHNMQPKTPKKAGQEDWHPDKIKYALRMENITLALLAAQHNLQGASGFSACLVRPMKVYEERIAAALKMHPKDLWPSRYNTDGTRKPQGLHAITQFTRLVRQRNGNDRLAA